MKSLVALVIILLFTAGGAWVLFKVYEGPQLPAELVGAWEVQTGPQAA